MPVTMLCPNLRCQQTVVAPESERGKIVRCAYCQQPFMVPTKAVEPVSVPPDTPDTKKKSKPGN